MSILYDDVLSILGFLLWLEYHLSSLKRADGSAKDKARSTASEKVCPFILSFQWHPSSWDIIDSPNPEKSIYHGHVLRLTCIFCQHMFLFHWSKSALTGTSAIARGINLSNIYVRELLEAIPTHDVWLEGGVDQRSLLKSGVKSSKHEPSAWFCDLSDCSFFWIRVKRGATPSACLRLPGTVNLYIPSNLQRTRRLSVPPVFF